jgi:hypothetical protein
MRPLFTVHAGEFLVGQHIEKEIRNKNVWVPTKDVGIDLLVTNSKNTRANSLQVKFSRDFLPIMKYGALIQKQLRSSTWFIIDRKHLTRSPADYWVLVLLGFEENSRDYLITKPKELLRRLEILQGTAPRYQTYVCVTKKGRAWPHEDLKRQTMSRLRMVLIRTRVGM